MTFCENVKRLVDYGIACRLLPQEERIYAVNQILELFAESDYRETAGELPPAGLEEILKELLDYAAAKGLLSGDSPVYRDLFDTRIMNCLMPRPSQVSREFWQLYRESPEKATDYYYKLSQDSDYIRRYRIEKDIRWQVESEYGLIDISINLSKPEKDPRAIAAAGQQIQTDYPKCQLCMENMGYAGRADHPARQNHRIIPLRINGGDWGFQYSPYVYFNEHCIVLNGQHVPMRIERDTFVKLLDFVGQFPHYFLGSNADLPIVGGSILSHDHYQGGNHPFAMAAASVERAVMIAGFTDVEAGIVKWPLSVLRIRSKDPVRLIDLADHILAVWRTYSDEAAGILASSDGEAHNTITPIARKREEWFELDLALRNNRTDAEHPLGIFHPHQDKHHIKKENIGLIEVMGLAILPARLKEELELLADCILTGTDPAGCEQIMKHADWVKDLLLRYPDIRQSTSGEMMELLKQEAGHVFVRVLEDAGVYKCNAAGRAAFLRFTDAL